MDQQASSTEHPPQGRGRLHPDPLALHPERRLTPRQGGERRVDLVLEGGGVRGIALVGALSVLEEHGYQPHNIAGTSAGAIVATLLAAGYTAAELAEIISVLDFTRFRTEANWERYLPVVGKGLSLFANQGIYDAGFLLDWLRGLLAARGVHTFRDLVCAPEGVEPRYRYRVQVIVSDITARRLLVLPRDAEALGIAPDDLEVALAVRMSMSIPIFFKPVRIQHAQTGQEHLIVDGGMLSNFPIWLFDEPSEPGWPTFGLRLVAPTPDGTGARHQPARPGHHAGMHEIMHFMASLVETMLEAHDRLYLERESYARTIAIPTLGIHSTAFNLTRSDVQALYASGRAAAAAFLETWDFDAYLAAFRRDRRRSRREEIAEQMRLARLGAP